MMVLAGLVGLRIRALYFTQSQRLSLGEVGLEEATATGTGGPGNTVEHCFCPHEYTGDSCEVNNWKANENIWHNFKVCAYWKCQNMIIQLQQAMLFLIKYYCL